LVAVAITDVLSDGDASSARASDERPVERSLQPSP
jgi:hypothetical protein